MVRLHARDVFRPIPRRTPARRQQCVLEYYDKEIPVPALKALREGVADGSIRPDVNIYAVYQCLLNAYTGTTIYENVSFGVSPVDVVQFTGELLVSYIKNEPDASVLAGKREKALDM